MSWKTSIRWIIMLCHHSLRSHISSNFIVHQNSELHLFAGILLPDMSNRALWTWLAWGLVYVCVSLSLCVYNDNFQRQLLKTLRKYCLSSIFGTVTIIEEQALLLYVTIYLALFSLLSSSYSTAHLFFFICYTWDHHIHEATKQKTGTHQTEMNLQP